MMINDVYICVCVDCYCWMVVYRSQVCLQFPSFFDDGTGINSGPPTKTSMLKFGEAYGESVCFWYVFGLICFRCFCSQNPNWSTK